MISVHIDTVNVEAKLSGMPEKVRKALYRTIDDIGAKLEAHVKNDKLQGQVLNHITGHLQQSINHDVQQSGNSIVGRVYSNSSVDYAASHEFGYHGTEEVREHIRHVTQAFGRSISEIDVVVRAHTRNVNMPERSFLRSSLEDMKEEIIDTVTKAAQGACKL